MNNKKETEKLFEDWWAREAFLIDWNKTENKELMRISFEAGRDAPPKTGSVHICIPETQLREWEKLMGEAKEPSVKFRRPNSYREEHVKRHYLELMRNADCDASANYYRVQADMRTILNIND